jgi:hypothetical protein
MDELVKLVTNQGFAVVIALYSLVVLNKTVQRNTDVMTKIATKLGINTDETDSK